MENQKTSKLNKKLFGVVALVVIGIGAIFLISPSLTSDKVTNPNNSESDNSRIIDWRHVHGLGFDPADRSTLYISTHGDFYQSINGSPPIKVDKVRADYMAFNAPTVQGFPMYASGHPSTGGNTGLIKSNDGGVTWQHVSNVIEPPVDFHAMAVSTQNPEIIIGFDSGARGLFKTIDAGKTWETLNPPDYISALAISPDDSGIVVAGTGEGIFKSINGGETWDIIKTYQGLDVYALAFDNDGKLFASIKTIGLVHSEDLGESWEDFAPIDLTVTSIAADSLTKELYVGGFSAGGFHEVYKINYDSSSYELIGTNKGLK